MDGIDEALVHRDGYLCGCERSLERVGIATCACEELQLLCLRAEKGGARVLDPAIGAIDAVVGALAKRPVTTLHEREVAAVRDRMPVTL